MPEMDGREFYRRVREAGYSGPIILVSAYDAEVARLELGAEAAISKPFHAQALATKLKEVL